MIKSKAHTELEMRILSHFKNHVQFNPGEGTIYVNAKNEFEEELVYFRKLFGDLALTQVLALIEGMYHVYVTHVVSYDNILGSYGTEIVKYFYVDGELVRVVMELLSTPDENDDMLISIVWDK